MGVVVAAAEGAVGQVRDRVEESCTRVCDRAVAAVAAGMCYS
jgi:hypothetical protein